MHLISCVFFTDRVRRVLTALTPHQSVRSQVMRLNRPNFHLAAPSVGLAMVAHSFEDAGEDAGGPERALVHPSLHACHRPHSFTSPARPTSALFELLPPNPPPIPTSTPVACTS